MSSVAWIIVALAAVALVVLALQVRKLYGPARRACPQCGRSDTGGRLCNPCRTSQGMPYDRTVP